MAFVAKPTNTEPQIVFENTHFVVVEKPHGLPTAPLKEDDKNTYFNYQRQIRNKLSKLEGGPLCPIEWEGQAWIAQAKNKEGENE